MSGQPSVDPRVLAALLALGALCALTPPSSSAAATRCLRSELDIYEQQIRPLPLAEMAPAHEVGSPMAPPLDPDVGDSWLWYTWKLAGFPVAEQKLCTVRGEGENVYIVVEDSQWLTQVDQEDIDRMLLMWDETSLGAWPDKGIHQLDTENFGPVPDALDGDPKVYVLYYDFDVSADGFFWAFDQFPDGSQDFASNECETLYMNSSTFDPGGDYLISVQAHEFQHMIHWLADANEIAWVNEGCSELAMWLFGHPDDVVQFPGNPDNSLTAWNSVFADYVKTYLYFLYLYEHFGGQATILDLVSQPGNSNLGVQAALTAQGFSETFATVVRDWTIANYLDEPGLEGGIYDYAGEDLPPFNGVTKSTYPVVPTNATVNHYAADYIRLTNGQPQRLFFDGGDTSDWSARVIRYQAGVPLSVEAIPLDAADAGFIDLPGFGSTFDQVVLVVSNISTSGVTTYQYSTGGVPTSAPDGPATGVLSLSLSLQGPNPFTNSTTISLVSGGERGAGGELVQARPAEVAIWNANGRLVRVLGTTSGHAGRRVLEWDGCDAQGRAVPSGVYFAHAVDGAGSSAGHGSLRLVLAR